MSGGRVEHQSLQKGQEGGITKYLTLIYGVAVMKWTVLGRQKTEAPIVSFNKQTTTTTTNP